MGDIFREIDEELRHERFEKLWRRYGNFVYVAAAVLVIGVAGYQGWTAYTKSQREAEGDRFAAATTALVEGKTADATALFGALGSETSSGYGMLARLHQAALRAKAGDRAGAIKIYDALSAENAVDRPIRDLATLLSVMHQLDGGTGDSGALSARLIPLAKEGVPWRHSALELLGLIAQKDGDKAKARKYFQQIADDLESPPEFAGGQPSSWRSSMVEKKTRWFARPSLAAAILIAVLPGCGGGYFGTSKDAPPLKGKRISVLALDSQIKADARLATLDVRLPAADRNNDWPQNGGIASHVMHHLAAKTELARAWRVDIGTGSSDDKRLMAQPVTDGTHVYTMDGDADVRAYDLKSGDRKWRVSLEPDHDDDGILGGGIAVNGGRIFVTTGFAFVIALDASTGKEIWRRRVSGPMRAAPTVYRGRVIAVTLANETIALSANDGRPLWTHTGISEAANLLGAAAPAAGEGIVVVPYSSGEIVAMRAENGRVLWSDALAAVKRTDPISALAHIRGAPVIDRDRVFVVAHSGRMVAIDLRTGGRIWEIAVGGTQAPWVAGEFIFVVSSPNAILCISRRDGRVRWVRPLPRWEDEEDKEDPIFWAGPVLAGDRLLIAGSNGEVRSISPYTGEVKKSFKTSGPVMISPAVAQETVFLLTEDADLIAMR